MEDFRQFFKGVKDPRRSNATRHDFLEMPAVALLSSLCGGRTCVDMADFAVLNPLRPVSKRIAPVHASGARASQPPIGRRLLGPAVPDDGAGSVRGGPVAVRFGLGEGAGGTPCPPKRRGVRQSRLPSFAAASVTIWRRMIPCFLSRSTARRSPSCA